MFNLKQRKEATFKFFDENDLVASTFENKYAMFEGETPVEMLQRVATTIRQTWRFPEYDYHNQVDGYSDMWYELQQHYLRGDDIVEKFLNNMTYIMGQGSIMSQASNYMTMGSLSNCFIAESPRDSYAGILHTDQQLVQLMKRRGGVGIDISKLRPTGTPVNNPAKTSTGAVSFMHRYSNTTREVAQNGRRGALMISIDCRHPDVYDFATIKRDKVSVTGANVSVQIRDDFMRAVEADEDYYLRWPCEVEFDTKGMEYDKLYTFNIDNIDHDTVYVKKVRAKELYRTIIESAHMSAEPGLMFLDRHLDYSPCGWYPQYRGVTTNPCGEIFMSEYDACRLMAMVFLACVENPYTEDATINWELLYMVAYIQQRMMDCIVDAEIKRIDAILRSVRLEKNETKDHRLRQEIELWENVRQVARSGRRTGSGFTALGDMLAALGIKYDSDEAMRVVERVMRTKFKAELDCSIDLAIERGPFDGFNAEREATVAKFSTVGHNNWYHFVREEFPEQWERMQKYGRRNVSFSTVAPTGTVSMLRGTTSGIEPLFMVSYIRRRKINPGQENTRVDFVDELGDSWENHRVIHNEFIRWYNITHKPNWTHVQCKEHLEGFKEDEFEKLIKKSPWYGSMANDIDWRKRVELQGIVQKYTTHSISSTLNLPSTVTVEDVMGIYTESWKQGLKGVTCYVEGSLSGVLIAEETSEEDFGQHNAPKRPESLPCQMFISMGRGVKHLVIVGLMNDKPYEVFAIHDWKHDLPAREGFVTKIKRGVYNVTTEDGEVLLKNITNAMNDSEEALTRMISTSLRHGAAIQYVVEQLNKNNGVIQAFSKVIARNLKRYIPDNLEVSTQWCDAGGCDIRYEEGCAKCMTCGESKC